MDGITAKKFNNKNDIKFEGNIANQNVWKNEKIKYRTNCKMKTSRKKQEKPAIEVLIDIKCIN